MYPDYVNKSLAGPREIVEISGAPLAIITLQEAKEFMRVVTDVNDAMIQVLIDAARAEAESITGARWGTYEFSLSGYGYWHKLNTPVPLQEINEVSINGTPAEYKYYLGGLVEITTSLSSEDIVKINYSVGYTTAQEDIKHACLQRVKFAYDNGDDLPYPVGRFFDHLVNRYRVNWTG
jgi:hypothetical protein